VARRRKDLFDEFPKLEPGDKVPRTGKFRLDGGVRVEPIHRYKSKLYRAHPEKPRSMTKRKRKISFGVRRRRRRY
jgi:hypothetical protein